MYFSKINNPKGLRKQILIAAKDAILYLSNQEEITQLKKSRVNVTNELNKIMIEINIQSKILNELLPYKDIKKEEVKSRGKHFDKYVPKNILTKRHINKFGETSLNQSENFEVTDANRLNYTLKKIEEKISMLDI